MKTFSLKILVIALFILSFSAYSQDSLAVKSKCDSLKALNKTNLDKRYSINKIIREHNPNRCKCDSILYEYNNLWNENINISNMYIQNKYPEISSGNDSINFKIDSLFFLFAKENIDCRESFNIYLSKRIADKKITRDIKQAKDSKFQSWYDKYSILKNEDHGLSRVAWDSLVFLYNKLYKEYLELDIIWYDCASGLDNINIDLAFEPPEIPKYPETEISSGIEVIKYEDADVKPILNEDSKIEVMRHLNELIKPRKNIKYGMVILKFTCTISGKFETYEVKNSTGDPEVGQIIVSALKNAKFTPGMKLNKIVPVKMVLRFGIKNNKVDLYY